MSGWAFSWGLVVLTNPEIFTNAETASLFAGLAELSRLVGDSPNTIIGLAFMFLGIIRGLALFINGMWKQTPLVRMIMSGVSAFFLTEIMVTMAQGPPNTAVVTYFWLFLADCLGAKRATQDWYFNKLREQHENQEHPAVTATDKLYKHFTGG